MSGHALPGEWRHRAACRTAPALFAMPFGTPTRPEQFKIDRARAACRGCPVLHECTDWALTKPDPAEGMVAAGMTPKERDERRSRHG